jgi:hypothetical protein
MKRALLLGSLLLCASGIYAADQQRDVVADGKKRNEESYERMLQQTGWSDQKADSRTPDNSQTTPKRGAQSSQPKSS